jgi:hypothetical protein
MVASGTGGGLIGRALLLAEEDDDGADQDKGDEQAAEQPADGSGEGHEGGRFVHAVGLNQ